MQYLRYILLYCWLLINSTHISCTKGVLLVVNIKMVWSSSVMERTITANTQVSYELMKLSAIKELQYLSILFTPFSNEATQSGVT